MGPTFDSIWGYVGIYSEGVIVLALLLARCAVAKLLEPRHIEDASCKSQVMEFYHSTDLHDLPMVCFTKHVISLQHIRPWGDS